eukprot:COSAG03_NODE_15078_length_441_cov_2.190058_1_plen_30_part_10
MIVGRLLPGLMSGIFERAYCLSVALLGRGG